MLATSNALALSVPSSGNAVPVFQLESNPETFLREIGTEKLIFFLQTRKFSDEKLPSMVKCAENVRVTFMRILFILRLFLWRKRKEMFSIHIRRRSQRAVKKLFSRLRGKKKNLLIKSQNSRPSHFYFKIQCRKWIFFHISVAICTRFPLQKHSPLAARVLSHEHSRRRKTEHNWLREPLKCGKKQPRVGSFLMDYYVLICFYKRTRKIDQLWCQEHIATT